MQRWAFPFPSPDPGDSGGEAEAMNDPFFDDDLNRPLGVRRNASPGPRVDGPGTGRPVIVGGLLVGAGVAAVLYLAGHGATGEPYAVAQIETVRPAAAKPAEMPSAAETPAAHDSADPTGTIAVRSGTGNADQVEERSGVRVRRPPGTNAPGALVIQVPQDLGIHLTPAPDRRVAEPFERGVLPKVGADGSRPAQIYSRPVVTPAGLPGGAPRIAVIVGGMGLNAGATTQAIADLPGAVTLAFAPYGTDLSRQVAQAREGGHEILLQAPMEPFDYPGNDPGPQTLLTGAEPAQNATRLHWLMSRFPGYVGIVNFLGGKFTADAAAFGPVLREVAARGLIYVDDATSTRSLTDQLASGLSLPTARVDAVVDTVARPEAIEASLVRLESTARQRGWAVGMANGLPATVGQIARWTTGLEGRGIALVPLSAVAERGAGVRADRAANDR